MFFKWRASPRLQENVNMFPATLLTMILCVFSSIFVYILNIIVTNNNELCISACGNISLHINSYPLYSVAHSVC